VFPGTFLGLLLLAASACPGYRWIRVVEERKPRRDRTQLLEAAELLSLGGLFSSVPLIVTFLVVARAGILDSHDLLAKPKDYTAAHPGAVLLSTLVALVAANVGAYAVATVVYHAHQRSIVHESAFYQLFRHPPDGARAYVTAHLKDGVSLAGWFYACTAQPCPPDEQELVLVGIGESPLQLRRAGADAFAKLNDQCVVVPGATIAATYVTYGVPPPVSSPEKQVS
jgi:hypothetical protein